MSERLDQIESQQANNTANIADLITLSSNLLQAVQLNIEATQRNAEAIAELKIRAAETDARFNILVAEMRADRQALNNRIDNLEQAG